MFTKWKELLRNPKELADFLKVAVQILLFIAGYLLVDSAFENARIAYVNAETNATEMETKRLERESREASKYMLYDAVVKSLESKNVIHQEVAMKLVISSEGSPFRNGLLTSLAMSTHPEIKNKADGTLVKEKKYLQGNSQIEDKLSSDNGWDYDIFWCENSGKTAEKSAQQIVNHLNDKKANGDDSIGRVRVRMLPDSINEQPGYRISGNLIRFDKNEYQQAQALQQSTNEMIPFKLSLSRMNTKWYLSAFICPN
jgi:hypothetical protein